MLKKIGNFSTIMVIGMVAVVVPKVVFAWSEPSSSAPNGNVGAPINTSANAQVKTGMITAGQFASNGSFFANNIANDSGIYITGSIGAFGLLQGVNAANNTGKTLILNYYGGNVGIGTGKTTASQALDVNGYINASTGFCINGNCIQSWPSGGGISGSGTANYLTKWTGATAIGNSTIVDNGTSVGIGTASPLSTTKLDVAGGDIIAEQMMYVRHIEGKNWNDQSKAGDLYLQYNNGANNVYIDAQNKGGKVGIGTASPATKLSVNGDTQVFGNTYFGNSGSTYITSAGAANLTSLTITGLGTITSPYATINNSLTAKDVTISGTLTYGGHSLAGSSRTCATYAGGGKNAWTAECPAGQYLVSVYNWGDTYGAVTNIIKCCSL